MVKTHVPCPGATGVSINLPGATLHWLTSPVLRLTCLHICLSAVAAENWNAQGGGYGGQGFLSFIYLSSLSFKCHQYKMRVKQGVGRCQLIVMVLS